jgi:hypothetical protein
VRKKVAKGCAGFASKLSLVSEPKRDEICLTCVSRLGAKNENIFTLLFALNKSVQKGHIFGFVRFNNFYFRFLFFRFAFKL